jgi:YHS domain-containing protein
MSRATFLVLVLFAAAGFALADSWGPCCPTGNKCPAQTAKKCPVQVEPTESETAGGEALAAEAEEGETEEKAQTHCPVMGGKLKNKKSYVDYQGQRVYFCCPGCKKPFLKDPDKYFKKMAAEGVVPESVQTKCPLSGKDISKEVHTDYQGRRIYFCCPGCVSKFKEDPEKHLKKLEKLEKS